MPQQISVQDLFEDTHEKLEMQWVAGKDGGARLLTSDSVKRSGLALIGHLNFIHPNRIQIMGHAELNYLQSLGQVGLKQSIATLCSMDLAALIMTSQLAPPDTLLKAADQRQIPLFTSPQASLDVMNVLRHYLQQTLAEFITLHGVFMEVQGMGVLITGDSSIGKSELALELISRGHHLIADDIVEFYHVALDTLEGRCPPLLRDFLEVRGLGVLNIRELFGEIAVKLKKNLKFIVHLQKPVEGGAPEQDRLQIAASTEEILGVAIPKVCIPVAAGRNIAVLVEVAVRNHILHLRGKDSTLEFIQRHERQMMNS